MSSEVKHWPTVSGPQKRQALSDPQKKLLDEISAGLSAARTGMDRLRATIDGNDVTAPTVIRVRSGENLQTALDTAAKATGAVDVRVQPQVTFAGNYTLRARPAGAIVTVRPDFENGNLPPAGQWVTPDRTDLPAFKSADGVSPIFRSDVGANAYAFLGCKFEPLWPGSNMIELGNDGLTADKKPRGYVFDRCWFRGDPVKGQHRGIYACVTDMQVFGCFMENFFEVGRDSQCVGASATMGGHELAFNYFEASGENVMYGGSRALGGLCADIKIHDNLFTKDFAWQSMANPPATKNLFELKNGQQIDFYRNILENCWTYSQVGYAIVLTPTGYEPNSGESYVTIANLDMHDNVIRRVGAPFNMNNGQAFPGDVRDPLGKTAGTRNVKFRNNLIYDVNTDPRWRGAGRFQIMNGEANTDGPTGVVVTHNTVVRASFGPMLALGEQPTMGLTWNDNVMPEGEYGVHGNYPGAQLGYPMFKAASPTGQLRGNAFEDGNVGRFINAGPENVRVKPGTLAAEIGADFKVKPGGVLAGIKTTDGVMIGCDVAKLPTFTP